MLQQLLRKVRYLGWNKCEVDLKSASFSRMMTYLDVLTIFFYLSSFLVTTNTKIKILTIIFSGFESIFILLKTSMMFLAAKLMYFHLIHSIYRPPKPSWVFFLGASTLPQYVKLRWFATTKLQRISRNEQMFPKNDLKLMTWKKIILPNHIGITYSKPI